MDRHHIRFDDRTDGGGDGDRRTDLPAGSRARTVDRLSRRGARVALRSVDPETGTRRISERDHAIVVAAQHVVAETRADRARRKGRKAAAAARRKNRR